MNVFIQHNIADFNCLSSCLWKKGSKDALFAF